jgi:hypothetical protein
MGLSAQLERPSEGMCPSPVCDLAPAARVRPWLYPQVLSLDAPLVAVCWQWLFARSFHVAVSPLVLFVTAGCVWMIYAADHLLDVRGGAVCSARHSFVRSHGRSILLALMAIAFVTGVAAMQLPTGVLLGGVAVAGVVGIYLLVVHLGRDATRRYWPKEIVIGAVFAAGSSIASWSSGFTTHRAWPEIALFGALCTLNCAAVDCWEWKSSSERLRCPHRLTRWMGRYFYVAAIAIAAAGGTVYGYAPNALAIAIAVSGFLLMAVGVVRKFVSPETGRLFADAALLTPLLFLVR